MFTETYLKLSPATKPLNNLTQFGLVVQTTSRDGFPTNSDGHSFTRMHNFLLGICLRSSRVLPSRVRKFYDYGSHIFRDIHQKSR